MKMNSENIPPSSKENVSSQQSTRIEMPSKTQHNQKIGINKIGQLQRFRMNIPYYIALITTKRRTMPYIIVVGCIGVVALNTLMLHYIYGPGHPITWFRFHLMKQKGLLTEEQLWKEKIMKETYFIRAKTSQFNQKFDNDMSITRVP